MKIILHIAEAFGSGVLNYIKNLSKWQSQEYKIYIAYGIRPETPDNFGEQFDSGINFIKVEGFTRKLIYLMILQHLNLLENWLMKYIPI